MCVPKMAQIHISFCKFHFFPTMKSGSRRARIPGAHPARARHLSQCSSHLPQCFTPKHHSLLQPRLPNPCRLGSPRVGGMAASPRPSRGSPTRGQKWDKRGTKGKIGKPFARCARRAHVLSRGEVREGGTTPCVTYDPSVVSLRGPGQSPVYSSPHDAVSIFS